MKITIDVNGFVTGFYGDEVGAPTEAITVNEADFNVLLEYQDGSKAYDEASSKVIDVPKDAATIESERQTYISKIADDIIDSAINHRQQMKASTYAIKIQSKLINGDALTAEEAAKYDFIINQLEPWIAAVRAIENTAIANGTDADLVDYSAAGTAPQL